MFFLIKPTVSLVLSCAIAGSLIAPAQSAALKPVAASSVPTEQFQDDQLWTFPSGERGDYKTLLQSIDHSLAYLQTPSAIEAYQSLNISGVSRDRVIRSLKRFRELVRIAKTPKDLAQRVQKEFVLYKSVGKDGNGTVEFTAYFEPTYRASRTRTAEYRYPIYRTPSGLDSWPNPHPTRLQLEGQDGLQASKGKLKGLELAWLSDRLEAYLVQVQGSARLSMTDGSTMSIGFDGKTDYPYVSLGKELINDGKFKPDELSLPKLIAYFQANPAEMNTYIPRNNRFIFFRETYGAPATGSIGVPVSAERSIATDKSIMPPGALALLRTKLPVYSPQKTIETRMVSHYVLDQDTGSAIKGPGRVDIFMGTGEKARARAGLVNNPGELYYLLLKE